MLSAKDIEQIRSLGISEAEVLRQVEIFQKGIPAVSLVRPATRGDGIQVLGPEDLQAYARHYEDKVQRPGRAMKFVHASGEATRMFQALLKFFHESPNGKMQADRLVEDFFARSDQLPFLKAWEAAASREGLDFGALKSQEKFLPLLKVLLTDPGLNYPAMPKGLLPFHAYPEAVRTALEEHLVEAAAYVRDGEGLCRVHLTVSQNFRERFQEFLGEILPRYQVSGLRIEVELSVQKDSTKTVAVDPSNQPFRDAQGRLIFRQAGHGALLENLQELDSDLVFIKNVDNVVPERMLPRQVLYKKALGGLLVELQEKIFKHLQVLKQEGVGKTAVEEAWNFAASEPLRLVSPEIKPEEPGAQRALLLRLFDRPLRVCGMVANLGEPGGGPFWVDEAGAKTSLQIVESAQVDANSEPQKKIFRAATHFNPVDLVCGLRNYRGESFDLKKFSDPAAGFISQKSKDGKALKALELPGLWNGGMAHWTTVFVEVPPETFSPVKTVMDFLRPEHQP